MLTACVTNNPDGSVSQFVFGVGVLTHHKHPGTVSIGQGLDASVQSIEGTGFFITQHPAIRGVNIGRIRSLSVEVAPEAELLIEATQSPDGPPQVTINRPSSDGPSAAIPPSSPLASKEIAP